MIGAKLTVLLGIFCGITVAVLADDVPVMLADTPAAVQKIIQTQTGDGTRGDITKTTEDEETVYDVDLTAKDGSGRDFSVAGDGTLLSVEVPLNETPEAVQTAIRTAMSGGALESIDKNLADSEISFDVTGTRDGKKMDFTLSEDGTLLGREVALGDTSDTVQKAITAQLKGGTLKSIEENFDEDGTNFDVEVAHGGQETGFNVTADGTLASTQVALPDAPRPVQKTIRDRIGDGTVLRVDKSFVKERGVFPYDVEGRKDGKPFDFSVGPRGRFLGMND